MARPQPLGSVLQDLIDQMGYRQNIDEARAVEAWAALAGDRINAVTQKVWMERGTLFVKVRSATWRQQLQFQRSAWRDRLNASLGREVITEIVFR